MRDDTAILPACNPLYDLFPPGRLVLLPDTTLHITFLTIMALLFPVFTKAICDVESVHSAVLKLIGIKVRPAKWF